MKRSVIAVLLLLQCLLATAQIGAWRAYMSYNDPQQIEAAGDLLYVRASNSLYQYNKADGSITTYDKTTGLSDTYVSLIRWCAKARRLVVVYDNTNIDLLTASGDIINVSDIYNKNITSGSKTVNDICISGQYAYLACGFGIVKLNVMTAEISESYMLSKGVTAVTLDATSIYARLEDGQVMKAALTDNLINTNNWQTTDAHPSFEADNSAYEANISLVKSLKPGGPKYNYFDYMKFTHGRLYTTGGKHLNYTLSQRDGIIQTWDGSDWSLCQEKLDDITGYQYRDVTCLEVDPKDADHIFATSSHSGLYEFRNGQLINYYNADNSILPPVGGSKNMLLTDGVVYDQEGNLWVVSGWSRALLVKISPDNQWTNYYDKHKALQDNRTYMGNLLKPFIDSRNILWFVNSYWERPSVIGYDITNDVVHIYDVFKNQDGTKYDAKFIYGAAEDKQGNIWIATEIGPFYLEPSEIENPDYTFTQVKVPRNDGTDFADYLLNNIPIYDIYIDSGNRKWFMTSTNGVYLISADNMQEIHHFTAENSKLLSNEVYSCAINDQTGEVFFATEKGLCSFMGDATTTNEEMTKDNVWAYPNPVEPGYTGPITITGLSFNADVKIVSVNGTLITEGRSNGGSFVWNGCDRNGRRVASGVYMVVTATEDGSKGTVCKVAVIN